MAADVPFGPELLARELGEPPDVRAARLGHDRWITWQRVWAAAEREGITEDGELAAFIASRLWPDLPVGTRDRFVALVRERAGRGHRLIRPTRADDVVGARVAALMLAHGYAVGP